MKSNIVFIAATGYHNPWIVIDGKNPKRWAVGCVYSQCKRGTTSAVCMGSMARGRARRQLDLGADRNNRPPDPSGSGDWGGKDSHSKRR